MKEYDLHKYHKKLVIEAWMKSGFIGAIIGFSWMLVLSGIFFLLKFNGLWITLVTGVLITGVGAVLWKKYVFKTSLKQTARRLDALGLEERVVTMLEYGEQDSIIAQRQRNSTKERLTVVTPKQIKFTNILKPIIVLSVVTILSVAMMTISTVEANTKKPSDPIIDVPDEPVSPEDEAIAKLIADLRRIVDHADVSQKLQDDLHKLINKLELEMKKDLTLAQKIARIEDTRREILERIAEEKRQKTTIIDEMKKHDTTDELANAFETKKEKVIEQAVNKLVEDFLAKTVLEMKAFVKVFEKEIEQSIEDADIKNPELETALRDLVELLKSLIPIIEGDIPDETDLSDQIDEIVDQIVDSIGKPTKEEQLEEDIDKEIQDAIDGLTGSDSDDPEDPDKPKDPNDGTDTPEDPDEDGDGTGKPIKNPTIIDGETELTSEQWEQMKQEWARLLESGQITEEELWEIVNNYLNSVEIK